LHQFLLFGEILYLCFCLPILLSENAWKKIRNAKQKGSGLKRLAQLINNSSKKKNKKN